MRWIIQKQNTKGEEIEEEEMDNMSYEEECSWIHVSSETVGTGDILSVKNNKKMENQDGGVGRHTAPPRTTRTDRESNSKGDQHQGNRK